MMSEHPQFDEDFDLYAIGALDPEERTEIETHIRGCDNCAQKLAQAHGRLASFALTSAQKDPPVEVKQRLMLRIKNEQQSLERAKNKSQFSSFWSRPVTAWTFVAVFAIAALIFAISAYRLNHAVHQYESETQAQRNAVERANAVLELLTAKDTQRITLTSLPEKPQPTGRVLYHPDHGLLFYAQNLPMPPANRVYQLWLVPFQGDPISAGVFAPDSKGNASVILPPLPKGVLAKAFAVTIEPPGGVPKATGPKVLVGAA